jgi:hypothetical protein
MQNGFHDLCFVVDETGNSREQLDQARDIDDLCNIPMLNQYLNAVWVGLSPSCQNRER